MIEVTLSVLTSSRRNKNRKGENIHGNLSGITGNQVGGNMAGNVDVAWIL